MPLYRIVAGCAEVEEEPKRLLSDGQWAARKIRAGDTFESNKNYLALNVGGHIKYELVYGSGAPLPGQDPNQDVWDRNRETLEQFVDRMKLKGQMAAAGIVAVPTANPNPNPQGEQLATAGAALAPSAQGIPACNQASLAEMDETKLRAIAAEEEVDVSRCKSKADLVGTVRKALGVKAR